VDVDGNVATPGDDVCLGQTVAVAAGRGTHAFPNGQWNLQTTVDLNKPAVVRARTHP